MILKNLKINTQFWIGISVILLLELLMGGSMYIQTQRIETQTTTLYDHPMHVQAAISRLKTDILLLQDTYEDYASLTGKAGSRSFPASDSLVADIRQQFSVLHDRYLGPSADLVHAEAAFGIWNEKISQAAVAGQNSKMQIFAGQKRSFSGLLPLREKLLTEINHVNSYADGKALRLFMDAKQNRRILNLELFLFILAFLLLVAVINFMVLRGIRKPVLDLARTAEQFIAGDLSARSSFQSANEIGMLARSFNHLAENVQRTAETQRKVTELTHLIISVENPETYFRGIVMKLCEYMDSQMGGVFLLNENATEYVLTGKYRAESCFRNRIGQDHESLARIRALSESTVEVIRSVDQPDPLFFEVESLSFSPSFSMVIPLVSAGRTLALVVLVSSADYTDSHLRIAEAIADFLAARTESVISFRRLRRISERLEKQNRELGAQKSELLRQSDELQNQNHQLEIQKQQLGELSRLKTSFLSSMSHELRTPLNSVIVLSGVLNRKLSGKLPDEEYSYLGVIERNGRHLLGLINNILDFSRIEAGRETIEVTDFGINLLITEITEILMPQAEQKGIRLLFERSGTEISFSSDPVKCRHIIQNLIANAIRYTDAGSVSVGLALKEGDWVEVSVVDTGIGIPAADLIAIFEEFRQVDSISSRRLGGTGLGLSIAKKYAGMLGGDIKVNSIPGQGSEFILRLPLHYQETSPEKAPLYSTSGTNNAESAALVVNRTVRAVPLILAIDDDPDNLLSLKALLSDSFEIVLDSDGQGGIRTALERQPDLILMDITLPGIDGIETFELMSRDERLRHIPVIALTASDLTSYRETILTRGFVACITKPINEHSLFENIKKVLYG
jgi:signal transduction histidine kinase/CheY-like chemotaxis protein